MIQVHEETGLRWVSRKRGVFTSSRLGQVNYCIMDPRANCTSYAELFIGGTSVARGSFTFLLRVAEIYNARTIGG